MVNRLTNEERLERSKELGIIVDKEYEFLLSLFSWRISTKGYVETTFYDGDFKKTVKLHHFIVGTPVGDLETDHLNRNKLDNRLDNLEIKTRFGNSQNREYVDIASNFRLTKTGKYEVRITRDGITHQVGTFLTIEEAVLHRNNWYEIHTKNA